MVRVPSGRPPWDRGKGAQGVTRSGTLPRYAPMRRWRGQRTSRSTASRGSSNRICRIRSAIGETAGAAAPRTRGIGTRATAPGAGTRTSGGAPGRETRRAGTGETGERRAAEGAGKGAENAAAEGAERRATSATTQTGRGNAAGVMREARAETAGPRRSKRLKPEEGTEGHRPCSGLA